MWVGNWSSAVLRHFVMLQPHVSVGMSSWLCDLVVWFCWQLTIACCCCWVDMITFNHLPQWIHTYNQTMKVLIVLIEYTQYISLSGQVSAVHQNTGYKQSAILKGMRKNSSLFLFSIFPLHNIIITFTSWSCIFLSNLDIKIFIYQPFCKKFDVLSRF